MPEWRQEIRKRIGEIRLSATRETEIVEELSQHLEQRYEELRLKGATDDEAQAAAISELLNSDFLASEIARVERRVNLEPTVFGIRRGNIMTGLLKDISFSFRTMAKKPGFAVIAIIVLALGIGGNTAIFTIVNAVLLQPPPYKNPDRIVMVFETEPELPKAPITGPNYLDWKDSNNVFEATGVGTAGNANLTGAGEPARLEDEAVSAGFLEVLGVAPQLGRVFTAEEDSPGKSDVALLSNKLWREKFGSDPNIIGKQIILDGQSTVVVGVMPASFVFPPIWGLNPDIIQPLALVRNDATRGTHWLFSVARLKPGVSLQQAQTEMSGIAARLQKEFPVSNAEIGSKVISIQEQATGVARPSILILFFAVGFVLLIACANVANLLLTRTVSRQKEIAIRVSLGASRFRIVRQLLTESLILSLIGGSAGILLAFWAKKWLFVLSPPSYLPRTTEINLDGRVLGFTILVSIITGMLFGLVPAIQAARTDLNGTLKEGSGSIGGNAKTKFLRNSLVVVEVALSLVLLIGSGLMIRSLRRLLDVSPGFNPTNVLTARIDLPSPKYQKPEDREAFFKGAVEKIRSLPAVENAAFVSQLPLNGGSNGPIQVEGHPQAPGFGGPLVQTTGITPDYFRLMDVPLLKGRIFDGTEMSNTTNLAVVNQTLVHQFFANEDPIGKRISIGQANPNSPPVWREIIGVVGDVHQWALNQPPIPEIYMPYPQWSRSSMQLVVKGSIDPASLTKSVAAKIHELDKNLPLYRPTRMETVVSRSTSAQRFDAMLMGIFGGLALVLAAVGIYGVMSYTVAQQVREIGIRMALGAQRSQILKLVVGHGMLLTIIGVLIGLVGAYSLTNLMASLLFSVKATDVATFTAVPIILSVVALVACYLPARKAMRVDPMQALRSE
ncbi:MAG TPA: ABC transporter permease [Blastocatellia bacterium]|nr:ABC transporter permease [Blastocatellia bacterium]